MNLKDTFTCCKKHIYAFQKTYLANVKGIFANVIVWPHFSNGIDKKIRRLLNVEVCGYICF